MLTPGYVFFFKQKTAYEVRSSDWSSDVCSSDLDRHGVQFRCDDPVADGRGDDDQPVGADLRGDLCRTDPWRGDKVAALERGDRRLYRRQIGRASCRERVWQYV